MRGFTLIEIMVSLAIIAVITAVGATSFITIQKNSRDAQRKADLRIIQGALQNYYADHNFFPGDDEVDFINRKSLKSRESSNQKTYISTLPNDPTPGQNYCYRSQASIDPDSGNCLISSGACQSYRLCANLENPDSGETSSCSCGNPQVNYNYQLTPL